MIKRSMKMLSASEKVPVNMAQNAKEKTIPANEIAVPEPHCSKQ